MERRTRSCVDWDWAPLRSLLFAPGNHERKLEKVNSFGSDAIVLDLEDAVAHDQKDSARRVVKAALPGYSGQAAVLVRVNGAETGRMEDDLRAVVSPNVDGVMIPKVDRPEVLIGADRLLGELEDERAVEPGQVRILALIETALGVARCEEIACSAPSRVVTLVFGLVDFANDVGFDLTEDATELLYARSRVVVAARAGRLRPALDGPYLGLHDSEGLVADSRRSRQLGFQGRVVVYPPQVEPVQRAYAELDEAAVERNRQIVEAFEQAEAAGSASIQVGGLFVDYPIFERAKHKLRLFETLAVHSGQSA